MKRFRLVRRGERGDEDATTVLSAAPVSPVRAVAKKKDIQERIQGGTGTLSETDDDDEDDDGGGGGDDGGGDDDEEEEEDRSDNGSGDGGSATPASSKDPHIMVVVTNLKAGMTTHFEHMRCRQAKLLLKNISEFSVATN